MSKITLNSVSDITQSTSAQTTINTNSSTVQTAFDNTLSRDGTSPNQMGASLDMNSRKILNLPLPISGQEPLRLQDISLIPANGTVNISPLPVGGTATQVLAKNSSANYDVSWVSRASVYWASDYGAVGDGIVDDTAAIANALTTAGATGGIVQLSGKGAKYKVSSTLSIPTGVILQGGGIGGAVIGITSPTQVGTTLSWAGAKGSAIVQFQDLAHSLGVRDLRIDGNQLSPDNTSAYGILVQTNLAFQIQNVAVENVGYAFYWQGTVAGVNSACGPGSWVSNIRCINVYTGLTFNGGTNNVNAAVTDFDIFGVFIKNYVAYGINFVSGLDDIKIHGVFMQGISGSIGIIYNPSNVLTTAAPGGTIIDSLTYASVAGAQFCVCNYTQGTDNLINAAFISGAGGTITPQRNSGGIVHVNVLGTFGIPNFDAGNILIAGATSGATTLTAQAVASGTVVLPTGTTAVAGAGPFAIGSGSTLNNRIKLTLNGTDYWIPCSTTAY